MKLVIKELDGSAAPLQKIATGDEDSFLHAIRPHLYRHNAPAGSVKIQLLNASQVLLKDSELISILNIDVDSGTLGLPFFHGYVRFVMNYPLAKNTDYFLKLVGVGYTFSEAAYVGWVNDYDLRKVECSVSPNDGWRAPLDVELWEMKRNSR